MKNPARNIDDSNPVVRPLNSLPSFLYNVVIHKITYWRRQQSQSDAFQQMGDVMFARLRIKLDPAQTAFPHRLLIFGVKHIVVDDIIKVVQSDAHDFFTLFGHLDKMAQNVFPNGFRQVGTTASSKYTWKTKPKKARKLMDVFGIIQPLNWTNN